MAGTVRRGFTAAEKTEMWDRWQRGESIGRAFGKESSSIHFQISPYGGIRPAPRRRSRLALTLAERETISRGIVARQSARSVALQLGRAPSTVSREIKRNGGRDHYRAAGADKQAWAHALRPKRCKLARHPWLRGMVTHKTETELVARTDRRLAEESLSGRTEISGVARDDLPQSIRAGPRRA